MAVIGEQLHAEAVDRSKEGAIESGLNFVRAMLLQNALSCSLLHLIGGAVSKSYDDEVREDFDGVPALGQLDDALANRVGFARAGGRDHGKIAIEFFGESAPGGMIA
jgi:hypothetical protein